MRTIALILCVLLAACSGRPGETVMPLAAGVGQGVPIYFASTRGADDGPQNGIARDRQTEYGAASVSIPPVHTVGKVEAAFNADPNRHFVLTNNTPIPDRAAFRATLRRQFAAMPRDDRQAIVFVHGFNTNFTEGLFRHAQIMADFEISGVAVSYSWPSRGAPLAYAYDRDSVLFARDGLEALIADLRAAGASGVFVLAHSMGAHLTMETFRQMAIADPREPARSVDATALMAPDIDIDLFRSQLTRVDAMPRDFAVFVSKRDRALALSARLSGERNKLGNVRSIDQVADLDIVIVDVSEFANPVGLGHQTVVSSPALIELFRNVDSINSLLSNDPSGRAGLGQRVILTAQEATAVILSPVTVLGN